MPEINDALMAPLRRRFDQIGKIVEQATDLAIVERSKKGPPTGRVGSIRLCSAYDPVAEAVTFASSQGITPGDSVVLYGIGLGHHIHPLLEAIGADGRLVVVEANGSLIRAALFVTSDPGLLLDPRIELVCGGSETSILDSLSKIFKTLNPATTRLVIHMPSYQLVPEGFPRLLNAMEMIRMERRFPTIFGELEKENFKANLHTTLSSCGIDQLNASANGSAVAVVGAGPSLDLTAPFLSGVRSRVIILAADTAAPALMNAGIVPDMLFTADPQPSSRLHFELARRFDLPLGLLPTSDPGVVSSWTGPMFFGFIDPDKYPDPANRWAREAGVFNSGGSVSCLALETAIKMGASRIILFGHDFGFHNACKYASHTVPAIVGEPATGQKDIVVERNYFDSEVITSGSLYSYRRDFEKLAGSSPAPIYTTSPGGIRLGGIEAVSPDAPWPEYDKVTGVSFDGARRNMEEDPAVKRAFLSWLSD